MRGKKQSIIWNHILSQIVFCPRMTDSLQPRFQRNKGERSITWKENIKISISGRSGGQIRWKKAEMTCTQCEPGINDTDLHEVISGPWFISSQLVSVFMLPLTITKPRHPNQSLHSGTSQWSSGHALLQAKGR